jgi:hypothetical protein
LKAVKGQDKEGKEVTTKVHVGFRHFRDDGSKVDENGNKFSGWDDRYDEGTVVESPAVQPFNSVSRNDQNVGKSHLRYDFKENDDSD